LMFWCWGVFVTEAMVWKIFCVKLNDPLEPVPYSWPIVTTFLREQWQGFYMISSICSTYSMFKLCDRHSITSTEKRSVNGYCSGIQLLQLCLAV
jgi:hypothetical protein